MQNSVAQKEKKKLKEKLLGLKYDKKAVEAFLNDKNYGD